MQKIPVILVHPRLASRRKRSILGAAATMLALIVAFNVSAPAPAEGAPSLTVSVITWDVIGLDSNKPATGPAVFPVTARVCNSGTDASNVTASLVWDTTSSYISLAGPALLSVGSIAANSCYEFSFNAIVQRDAKAFDTTRQYHIDIAVGGVTAVTTPRPRQLYVEHLVSQNRNQITAITGPLGIGDPPATTVEVGKIYTYQMHGSTATNGYEQLEAFIDFPNTIYSVLSVSATYTAPSGATNTSAYADACGWDKVPGSATYSSCIGPTQYGGKAGGDIVMTYRVLIQSTGTATVTGVIYDFSGSSFHYNSDYGVDTVAITAVTPTTTTTTAAPTTTTSTTTIPPTTTLPPTTTTSTLPPTTTSTTTTTLPPTTTSTTTTTLPPTTTTTTTTLPPTTTTTLPPTTTTTTTLPPTTTTTTTLPPTTTTEPPTTTLPDQSTTSTTAPTTTIPGSSTTTTEVGGSSATIVVPAASTTVALVVDPVDSTVPPSPQNSATLTGQLPATGSQTPPLHIALFALLWIVTGTGLVSTARRGRP